MRVPLGAVSLLGVDGDAGGEPIGAVVERCNDERAVVVVQDASAVRCSVGGACEIRYSDPRDGRFVGVSCVVESIDQGRLTLRDLAETKSANQRLSFRVNMACSNMTARVGPFPECRLIDISATGIRVQTPKALGIGDTVAVRFSAEGQEVRGRFSVRRVREAQGGAQIGLSANPRDSRLNGLLSQLAAAAERRQLRRRSGNSAGARCAPGVETGAPDDPGTDESRDDHIPMDGPEREAWVRVPAALLAGRALPGSLVTEQGAAVASRGQVLGMDDFKKFDKEGLYAGEDWSPEHFERRANGRSSCQRVVRVVALQGERVTRMPAVLTDISRGGVGLRTPAALEEEAYLVVDFSNGGDSRWIIGRVVHRDIGDGERCRLGVQFYMSAPQTGPVPDSAPAFARWVSVKPAKGQYGRAG